MPADDGACPYCGTAAGVAVAPPPVPADPAALRAERFRRVRESPAFDRTPDPAAGSPAGKHWNGVLVGIVFAAISLIMLTQAGRHGGVFVIMPVAFIAIGIGMVIASANRIVRYRSAPSRTFAAIVAAKRMEIRRGKQGRTDYFVTLEFETGARDEYEAAGSMYGAVTEDDIGVADVRDTYLTGFRRVAV
jgi:hypothetical protein